MKIQQICSCSKNSSSGNRSPSGFQNKKQEKNFHPTIKSRPNIESSLGQKCWFYFRRVPLKKFLYIIYAVKKLNVRGNSAVREEIRKFHADARGIHAHDADFRGHHADFDQPRVYLGFHLGLKLTYFLLKKIFSKRPRNVKIFYFLEHCFDKEVAKNSHSHILLDILCMYPR